MSHRHGDHMGGLAYLLKVNPKVKIYAPKEGLWRRLAEQLLWQTEAWNEVLADPTSETFLRLVEAGRTDPRAEIR
jgi:metal-dependent hydrolase (beta-lactamase superfamily II)